jgi:hypothetical protein
MSMNDVIGVGIVLLMVAGLFARDGVNWIRRRYRG